MHSLNTIIQAKKDGVDLTSQEKRSFRYDDGIRKFLTGFEFEYFLTLTFKHPVYNEEEVKTAINQFINRMSVSCYGSRSSKRVITFSTIEKGQDDSYHVHMLMKDPKDRMTQEKRLKRFNLRDRLIESWMQATSKTGHPALASKVDEWFQVVDDVEEVVSYMLKNYNPNSSHPSTIIPWECASLDGRRKDH